MEIFRLWNGAYRALVRAYRALVQAYQALVRVCPALKFLKMQNKRFICRADLSF